MTSFSKDAYFRQGASKMIKLIQLAIIRAVSNNPQFITSSYFNDTVNPILSYLQKIEQGKVKYSRAGFKNRLERSRRELSMSDIFSDIHEFIAEHDSNLQVAGCSPGKAFKDSSWQDKELWWAQEALGTAILFLMREQRLNDEGYYLI